MWEISSKDRQAKPLIFMTGPLGGTIAPFGGRTVVAGYAPQGYPHEWYSRSTFGGYWGPELKYAGYDGIVVLGESPDPVYLWVKDGKTEIRDARCLWGLGHFDVQREVKRILGDQFRIVSIGQAGENCSRIAVIETETESAAGQGGFGGLMGMKRLKAIAVRGTGKVQVADPPLLMRRSKAIRDELRQGNIIALNSRLDPARVKKYGERWYACTEQCAIRCIARHYSQVLGPISGKTRAGQYHCCAPCFAGSSRLGEDTFYDWEFDFETAFDLACIANDLGINHWEIQFGLMPWLRYCKERGKKTHLDETPINVKDPAFWAELMRKIAYREGTGNLLAEGGYRAAKELSLGQEFADEVYAAWGYAGHWDGHGDRVNRVVFPFWLVSGLLWAVDTRDPYDSTHGYMHASMMWSPFSQRIGPATATGNDASVILSWEQLESYAERIYGTPDALDPRSGYKGKAQPAIWHSERSALKDSLFVCDFVFPAMFSCNHPDNWCRADGMDGIDFEWHLFTATTGRDVEKERFYRLGEKICNLERALQVLHHSRTRLEDEGVIPYLARQEWWENPILNNRFGADPKQFRKLLDEFYRLRGWSIQTGRPLGETLNRLELNDVAQAINDD